MSPENNVWERQNPRAWWDAQVSSCSLLLFPTLAKEGQKIILGRNKNAVHTQQRNGYNETALG